MKDQADVLMKQPFHGPDGVIAWGATDECFPCRLGETKCASRGQKGLPPSDIPFMSAGWSWSCSMSYLYVISLISLFNTVGWSCAQRRPLRALSHILTIYDPNVVIILDDDTFLNYDLLIKTFGGYFANEFKEIPVVMGEFQGKYGENGHLTTGSSNIIYLITSI